MKKTSLTFSVFLAVICCTLAYAAKGQGTLALFGNTSTPNEKPQLVTKIEKDSVVSTLKKHGMKISQESIHRANSRVATMATKKTKATTSSQGNMDEVVVDLWKTKTQIIPLCDGLYDAATNTLTFPGSLDSSDQIFAGMDETGFSWHAVDGRTYHFSGTLASDGKATVYPYIAYNNDGDIQIVNNMKICLDESNGFVADFDVNATGIQGGCVIMVGFLIEGSSSETIITSTNNQLYYSSYRGLAALEWTPDNDLPGLGLNGFEYGAYIFTCEDGVTTLGLYYDGNLFVTGINTTASEVVLPQNVTIGGHEEQIINFGYSGSGMDWSGAPNLVSLDASFINYFGASFSGSAITDLYVGQNVSFYNSPSGAGNIYLHIPYGASRSSYNYCGFKRVLVGDEQPNYPLSSNSEWVIPGENEGDYFGISRYNGYYCITEIFTEKNAVELPVETPADGGTYYIRYLEDGSYNNILCQNAAALKSVTIPQSYTNLHVNWSYCPIVDLHMQGDVPNTYWSLPSNMTVYVGSQSYYANYESNSNWNSAAIVPDGWDFEWMTVNVGRKGEFAQTYIEMTDADWSLGVYVKITGILNATDLQNIKKLTRLRKLDLSEAEFTSLPNNFLEYKTTLMEVTLPDSLSIIPQSAFGYCSALSIVSAPGVRSIGSSAFYNCSNLTDFDISKIKTINESAFSRCYKFSPTDLSSLCSIGSNAFYNTAIEEVVIPEGVTTISSSAFSECRRLSRVVLPNSITSIDSYAFNQCTALTSINLPEGITSIGYDAFNYCSSLSEISIPSTLQNIGYDTFDGCSSLVAIKCKAIVPPMANGGFTDGMDLNHCTLYVAPFAIDAYRASAYWNAFYIMKPLNEPVKNIYINRPITFDLLSEDDAVLQENPNMTLDYGYNYNYGNTVGQLSASGDGTLSAGIFTILHSFQRRQNPNNTDYRTTLVNNAENMRADSVLCSINFEKNRWHFISFQYDVQMSDIFGENNTDFVIRQYNGENRASGDGSVSSWENVPADGVLKAGKGYIIQAANNSTNSNGNSQSAIVRFPSRNTVSKNNLFTSNNVIVPLDEYPAEFAHNRSWNLVGNPYPCYYDMHYLMDDFSTPIVLWRGTSYQAYSPIDDDIILRPNESFFVQCPLDAEQMVFGVEGRMHYSEAYNASYNNNSKPGIYYALSGSASDNIRNIFNFNIKGCGNDDRARIVMNEKASMEYEINRDASKFFAETAEGVEIYVDGDIKYDICERPFDNGTAILGVRIATEGEYTISLSGRNIEGWSVILTDTETGISTDLCSNTYKFDASAGSVNGRFIVTFKDPIQTSINDVNVSSKGDSNVRIVNAAGATVFEGKLNEFKTSAPAGVYVVVDADKAYKIVVK